MLKTSIIIPFKNAKETLQECVNHVLKDRYPAKEIILVDDGSEDNSTVGLPDSPEIKRIRLNESKGPAFCRNLGAGQANGEVLVFIDSDIMIPGDTLSMFAETFNKNPGVAAVVGMLSDRCRYPNLYSCYFNLRKHYDYLSIKDTFISAFYTSICSIRKNVFQKYDGFSSRYHTASVEDAELASRLIEGGEKIMLNKKIRVDHKKYHNLLSLLKSDYSRAVLFGKLLIEKRMAKRVARKKRFFSFRMNSIITSLLSLILIGMIPIAFFVHQLLWIIIILLCMIVLLNFRFILLSLNRISGFYSISFILLLIIDYFFIGVGAFQGILSQSIKQINRS